MSAEITSINYCPVKSVSFQSIEKCKIKIINSYSKKLIELLNVQPRKSNIHLDLDNKDFQKYADIAASAQKLVEDILIKIFKNFFFKNILPILL